MIDKILNMVVAELLPRVDDSMKIGFHELSNDVNVSISSSSLRLQDIDQSDDIVVFEKLYINMYLLSNFISRTIRLASIRSSKALIT